MRCHVSGRLCGVEGERKWAPLRNRRNESEASFDGKLRMDWINVSSVQTPIESEDRSSSV